jgi:hypothetical protein
MNDNELIAFLYAALTDYVRKDPTSRVMHLHNVMRVISSDIVYLGKTHVLTISSQALYLAIEGGDVRERGYVDDGVMLLIDPSSTGWRVVSIDYETAVKGGWESA